MHILKALTDVNNAVRFLSRLILIIIDISFPEMFLVVLEKGVGCQQRVRGGGMPTLITLTNSRYLAHDQKTKLFRLSIFKSYQTSYLVISSVSYN